MSRHLQKILTLIIMSLKINSSFAFGLESETLISAFGQKNFIGQSFTKAIPEGLKTILCYPDKLIGILFCTESADEKKVTLSQKFSDRVDFFVSNYKPYTNFLFKAVYKDCKIEKLEIPCIVFFKNGRVQLPLQSVKTKELAEGQIDSFVQSHLLSSKLEKKEEEFECFSPKISGLPF